MKSSNDFLNNDKINEILEKKKDENILIIKFFEDEIEKYFKGVTDVKKNKDFLVELLEQNCKKSSVEF